MLEKLLNGQRDKKIKFYINKKVAKLLLFCYYIPMPNDRMSQINKLIKQEVALALHDLFADEFLSVTKVDTSKDISYSKIWIASVNDVDLVVKKCQRKAKLVQKTLFKKLDMKQIPSLHFVPDKTDGQADKIEAIIDQLISDGELL